MNDIQRLPLPTDQSLGHRITDNTEGQAIDPHYFVSGTGTANFKVVVAPSLTHTWRVPVQFPSESDALCAFRNPSFCAGMLWRMIEEWLADDEAEQLVEHISLPEAIQAQVDELDLTMSQYAQLIMQLFRCSFLEPECGQPVSQDEASG